MIFNVILSSLPVFFLINFFYTQYRFNKNGIALEGTSPINYYLFIGTKYLLAFVWLGMSFDFWNISMPGTIYTSETIENLGKVLWCAGFLFLYFGWFSLGKNIRMGVANEKTEFVSKGIYKISRNPMYLGLYLSFIGGSLFTLNIIHLLLTIHIIVVHHLIIIAEEKKLISSFGEEYENYLKKVRRYL